MAMVGPGRFEARQTSVFVATGTTEVLVPENAMRVYLGIGSDGFNDFRLALADSDASSGGFILNTTITLFERFYSQHGDFVMLSWEGTSPLADQTVIIHELIQVPHGG